MHLVFSVPIIILCPSFELMFGKDIRLCVCESSWGGGKRYANLPICLDLILKYVNPSNSH